MNKLGIRHIILCICVFILAGAVIIVFRQCSGINKRDVNFTVPEKSDTGSDTEIFNADNWSVFSDRTAEDIAERYAASVIQSDENNLYESFSDNGETYNISILSDNVKSNIISNINYYRWLEGVPEISVLEEKCLNVQAAVFYDVIQSQNKIAGKSYPDNMPEELSKLGVEAIAESIVKPTTVGTAVRDSLCGGLDFNEDSILKSRMAIMSYKSSEIAVGYYSGVFACSSYGEENNMVYAFASYPSPGLFPANDIDKELSAWHIELNSGMIIYDEIEDINVQITDMTDGTVYSRDLGDGLFVSDGLIVFYPPEENGTIYKHKYQVQVYGLKTITGKDAAIKYTVDFFDRTEYENTEIVNIKSEYNVIYAPKNITDLQLTAFFPVKAEAELDNGRILDINILNWTQSVSEGVGFDENRYIAVIDDSSISKFIVDTDNMLRNIGLKVIRYQDGLSINGDVIEDGKTELSVASVIEKIFSDISWYYEDEDGNIQFIEASERLYIDSGEERRLYFALAKDTQEENIVYIILAEY